jgi:hypothetical protein
MSYRSLSEQLNSLRSVAEALDPIGALSEYAAARAALNRILENHIAALEILQAVASEAAHASATAADTSPIKDHRYNPTR